MSLNLWKEFYKARKFDKLSKVEQDDIIRLLRKKEGAKSYYAAAIINLIYEHIDDNTFFDLAHNFMCNGAEYRLKSSAAAEIFSKAYKVNQSKMKSIVYNSKLYYLNRLLLTCDNITLEEEILGLRALSKSKHLPNQIRMAKYRPRLEALTSMPPIMRLKALEALADDKKIKYNIFSNVPEDKFKELLFTASFKYVDRANNVYSKFKELQNMGVKSTVRLSGNCGQCGEFSITITSNIMRTLAGLKKTGIGRYLHRLDICPFCYEYMKQNNIFEVVDE